VGFLTNFFNVNRHAVGTPTPATGTGLAPITAEMIRPFFQPGPANLYGDKLAATVYQGPYSAPGDLENDGSESTAMRAGYNRIYREEPSIRSAIDGKVNAIACLDVSVQPADKSKPNDRLAAEFCEWAVEETPHGWDGLLDMMLRPAFINGMSYCEKTQTVKEWSKQGQLGLPCVWGLDNIRSIDPLWIRLQLNIFWDVTAVVNLVRGLEYFSPDNILLYTHNGMYNNPFGQSDLRACWRAAGIIEDAYKAWYLATKLYGLPYMLGKTTPQRVGILRGVMQAIRQGGWAVVDKEQDEVEVLNLAASTGTSSFPELIKMLREDCFLVIRGAYTPFLESSGSSDSHHDTGISEDQANVSELRSIKGVCRVIRRQLFPWLVGPNFPVGTGLPMVKIGGTDWEKTEKLIQVFTAAQALGMEIDPDSAYDLTGIVAAAPGMGLKPNPPEQPGGGMGGPPGAPPAGGPPALPPGPDGPPAAPKPEPKPAAPAQMSEDAQGHEHAGKGEHGGQFVSKGGGGSGGDSGASATNSDRQQLTPGQDYKDTYRLGDRVVKHASKGAVAKEVAASKVAKIAGINSPESKEVTGLAGTPGKTAHDAAVSSAFIKDAKPLNSLDSDSLAKELKKLPAGEIDRNVLFGFLVGDDDRDNGGNYLIGNGKLHQIDFSLAFKSDLGSWPITSSTLYPHVKDSPVNPKVLSDLAKRGSAMADELRAAGHADWADGVEKRAGALKKLVQSAGGIGGLFGKSKPVMWAEVVRAANVSNNAQFSNTTDADVDAGADESPTSESSTFADDPPILLADDAPAFDPAIIMAMAKEILAAARGQASEPVEEPDTLRQFSDDSDHPRGQPDNAGQFVKKGEGGGDSKDNDEPTKKEKSKSGDEPSESSRTKPSRFEKADYDHYRDVRKRNADMRLRRAGETDEDVASLAWKDNEKAEGWRKKRFDRDNVHLVDMPVSMLEISDSDVVPERQQRLDKIGGSDDPAIVHIDGKNGNSSEVVFTVDDGNNRAAWAKKNGRSTIPAFVHGDAENIVKLREQLAEMHGKQFSDEPAADETSESLVDNPLEVAAALLAALKAAGADEDADDLAELMADPSRADELLDLLADDDEDGEAFADGIRTFASKHKDGETWQTGKWHFKREGGKTRRIADPNRKSEPKPARTGPTPQERAQQLKAAREPARQAARDAYAKAKDSPHTLTHEDVAGLVAHLDSLTVVELKEHARAAMERLGGYKADLVRRLVDKITGGPLAAPAGEKTAPDGTPESPSSTKAYTLPVESLHVDPKRFQFKLNTNNPAGVTDEMKEVDVWNPDFAGVTSVWKDPEDGKTYIVNGHHRRELAGRLGAKEMNVKYIQAKTAQEARAIGALVNIAEGRGTAVDAAKFMRDTGSTIEDFKKRGVSLKGGGLAEQAVALTKLNDKAFDRVARGELEVNKALAVAKHLGDPERQEKLFKLLEKRQDEGKQITDRTMEEMARAMAAAPSVTKTENTLWGPEETTEDVFVQRAELAGTVRNDLAREMGNWAAVSSAKRAASVSGAGNVLNVDENKRQAEAAEQGKNLYDTLVNRKGPISDALNEGAVKLAKAKSEPERKRARSETTDAVRQAIKAEFDALDRKPGKADGGAEGPAIRAGETPPEPAESGTPDPQRPSPEPAGLTPPEPGFTGVDANGHEWRDGVQVAKADLPADINPTDPPTFPTPGNYRLNDEMGNRPSPAVQAKIDRITGGLAPEHIAALANAPSGAKVNVHYQPWDDSVKVTAEHKEGGGKIETERTLRRDPDGKLTLYNDQIDITEGHPLKGQGFKSFIGQVQAARAAGVSKLDTEGRGDPADRESSEAMNGYYTWPRLGYDGEIPEQYRDKLPGDLKKQMGGQTNIATLMATPAGREWWKANGGPLDLSFDLSEGSPSMRLLASYAAGRTGVKPATPAEPPADSGKSPTIPPTAVGK
jgi:hypothetical protein